LQDFESRKRCQKTGQKNSQKWHFLVKFQTFSVKFGTFSLLH
jgi:hypothetical protein